MNPAPPQPPLWQKASAFAARQHRHQIRKDGGTPYVSHCFRVAMTVRDTFGLSDPALLCAALLHDTIEDTTTDYDDLLREFGPEVAGLVAILTKNMTLPEAERERLYDENLARASWKAKAAKLADTYDNFHDAGATGMPVHKAIAKVRRALAIAEADPSATAELAPAIAIVRQLLASAE